MNKTSMVLGICLFSICLFGCIQSNNETNIESKLNDCQIENFLLTVDNNGLKQENYFLMHARQKDIEAMYVGLEGYAVCHIVVSCELDPAFFYSGFACSDLSESDLWELKKECFVSENYFDYVVYVAGLEAEQGQ